MEGGIGLATSLSSTVTLNDGQAMPMFGLGTAETSQETILAAIHHGYRLLDTANIYRTEGAVGRAVKESGVPRSELFISTKVWQDSHGFEKCSQAVQKSLEVLGMEYIDMMLIHVPTGGKILDTYDCLLKFKSMGIIKSVGVSNFGVQHLERIKASGRPLPAVNQIELHPFYHNDEIVNWCKQHGVAVQGFSPLAKAKVLDDPTLQRIANKHGLSTAHVMIRWSVQCGYITIPRPGEVAHVAPNTEVFDWSLDDHDMRALEALKGDESKVQSWDPTMDPWD